MATKKTRGQTILKERKQKGTGFKNKHVGLDSTPDRQLAKEKGRMRTSKGAIMRDFPGKEVGGQVGKTAYEAFAKAGGNDYLYSDTSRQKYDKAVSAAGAAVRKLQARLKAKTKGTKK